ncbi:MAG: hypothetical protein IIA59_10830 [Candidatus Marinimicrobia bacterium]|nr:hypothetical protein [Candidatus Neomarinimicrobiota bacterium]
MKPLIKPNHILTLILLLVTAGTGQGPLPAPSLDWAPSQVSPVDSANVWTLESLIGPLPGQRVYDWSFLGALGPPGFSWEGSVRFHRFAKRPRGGHAAIGVNFGSQYFQEHNNLGSYTEQGYSEEEEYYGYRNYLRSDLVLSWPGIITSSIYGGAGFAVHSATKVLLEINPVNRHVVSSNRTRESTIGLSAHLGVRATILYVGTDLQIGVIPGREGMLPYGRFGLVTESDFNDKRFYKMAALSGVMWIASLIVIGAVIGLPF